MADATDQFILYYFKSKLVDYVINLTESLCNDKVGKPYLSH